MLLRIYDLGYLIKVSFMNCKNKTKNIDRYYGIFCELTLAEKILKLLCHDSLIDDRQLDISVVVCALPISKYNLLF